MVYVQAIGKEPTGFAKLRLMTFLFGFCMFATGASGLVNEYVLATISSYILGGTVEQFSFIIALMMLMMGVSGWVQKKVPDWFLLEAFMGIEISMALLGGFAPLAIYAAFGYMSEHFLLVLYGLVTVIGFLIGFEIPIVMRIINKHGASIKRNLAVVYAMDYVGAFVGAVIWVKFLLKNFPLTEISFIVAGFNFAVAAVTVAFFAYRGVVKNWKIPVTVILAVAIALAYGYTHNREWNIKMEQRFYDDPIVASKTTKYQHLVVTENKETGDVRLYINGNTQFSSIDEKRYHELLVHPVMALNPYAPHVLILGGGDGLALREVLKYRRVRSVTLVDLDPEMVKMAKTNPYLRKINKGAFDDARVVAVSSSGVSGDGFKSIYMGNPKRQKLHIADVNVIHVDADKFVGSLHDKRWGVVIIDFPDPSSVELAKLYSREFYRKLKRLMTPNGLLVVQSTSPFFAKEVFLTIGRTLESAGFEVLPFHQNIPSFGEWGFYLAWKKGGSADIKRRVQTLSTFEVETEYVTPDLFRAALVFGKGELTPESRCVNTLMQPCVLDLYLRRSWLLD